MESLEAIRQMNSKHPDGRLHTCIADLCARVEALEKENKMLRDASEQTSQAPPAPILGPLAQTTGHDAPATAEARSEGLSISSIRTLVARGDPVLPWQVLVLCARVEALEEAARGLLDACAVAWTKAGDETMYLSDAELHMGKVLGGGGVALHALVTAARAWAGAITQEHEGDIDHLEGELLEAVLKCG